MSVHERIIICHKIVQKKKEDKESFAQWQKSRSINDVFYFQKYVCILFDVSTLDNLFHDKVVSGVQVLDE